VTPVIPPVIPQIISPDPAMCEPSPGPFPLTPQGQLMMPPGTDIPMPVLAPAGSTPFVHPIDLGTPLVASIPPPGQTMPVGIAPSPSSAPIPTPVFMTGGGTMPMTSPAVLPGNFVHPTLSSWLKNMNKLSGLIDRIEELASSAPEEYQTQLSRRVAKLRATFKKQQERCIEFLQLSEEYADKYLLHISAEIKQQSSFLDMLEKRLDMAKTLHRQAADLRKSYESGTVANMKDVRATGKTSPCCLQRKNAETSYFQHYCSRYQRTLTCLAKWTLS